MVRDAGSGPGADHHHDPEDDGRADIDVAVTIILDRGKKPDWRQQDGQACPRRSVLGKTSPIDEGRNNHDAAADSKESGCETAEESNHDKNKPEGHGSGPHFRRYKQPFLKENSTRIDLQLSHQV